MQAFLFAKLSWIFPNGNDYHQTYWWFLLPYWINWRK